VAVLRAEFRAMATVPYLAGVNYWAAVQASTSILTGTNGNWALLPAGSALASFFNRQAQAANIDEARFNWDDGTTQDWSGSGLVTNLTATTAMAYRGHGSLAVSLAGPGAGGIVTGAHLAGLSGGSTVVLHIYVPPGMGQIAVHPYVVDATGKTVTTATSTPQPGTWARLAFTVPPGAQAPLQRLGLDFNASGPGGVIFVDSVDDASFGG
jgi:hypothetical protein